MSEIFRIEIELTLDENGEAKAVGKYPKDLPATIAMYALENEAEVIRMGLIGVVRQRHEDVTNITAEEMSEVLLDDCFLYLKGETDEEG